MKFVTYTKSLTRQSYQAGFGKYVDSGIELNIPSVTFHMFCLINLNINIRMAASSPLRTMFRGLGL